MRHEHYESFVRAFLLFTFYFVYRNSSVCDFISFQFHVSLLNSKNTIVLYLTIYGVLRLCSRLVCHQTDFVCSTHRTLLSQLYCEYSFSVFILLLLCNVIGFSKINVEIKIITSCQPYLNTANDLMRIRQLKSNKDIQNLQTISNWKWQTKNDHEHT